MDGSSLQQAARGSATFFGSVAGRDWNVPIPDMTWTVIDVAMHIPTVLLYYAVDLAAGPQEITTVDVSVRAIDDHDQLVTTITAAAAVLARVVDGTPPGRRGWHPEGLADASGFAAMAGVELLVHTWDVGRGVGIDFWPPPALSAQVLRRLFPWAPQDVDPWRALLWATGRTSLEGLPRQTSWRPHPAPLTEWDGTAR